MTLRQLVDHPVFNWVTIGLIVLNAVLIGWSTYDPAPWIRYAEKAIVALFAVEIALRFAARTSTRAFVSDGWNIFDVVLVASAFVGASNGIGPALRILRVLRVLRLVKTVPELRLIVTVLLRSVTSMKYIGLLALICFYIYAVIGVKMFGGATVVADGVERPNPLAGEFASVHEACFTLFRVLTGDAWAELRYAAAGLPFAPGVTFYFVSWIVIATFILINLIVGAIINNYQKVQDIEQSRHLDVSDKRLRELLGEVQAILAARSAERALGSSGGSSGGSAGDGAGDERVGSAPGGRSRPG